MRDDERGRVSCGLSSEVWKEGNATGVWTHHWVYWVGPLLGSALAVRTYDYLRTGSSHDYRTGS